MREETKHGMLCRGLTLIGKSRLDVDGTLFEP